MSQVNIQTVMKYLEISSNFFFHVMKNDLFSAALFFL